MEKTNGTTAMELYVEKYKDYILKQGGYDTTSTGKLKSWGYLQIWKGTKMVNKIKYAQGSSGFFMNNVIKRAKARIDAGQIEKYKMYNHKVYGPNSTKNSNSAGLDCGGGSYSHQQTKQI
jgi:hypothetical protein